MTALKKIDLQIPYRMGDVVKEGGPKAKSSSMIVNTVDLDLDTGELKYTFDTMSGFVSHSKLSLVQACNKRSMQKLLKALQLNEERYGDDEDDEDN